jgi:hypothetical protein
MVEYDIGSSAIIATVVLVSFIYLASNALVVIALSWLISQNEKLIMTNNFVK